MKFYDSIGPNPRVVRMAMAEKGMSLPTETIDIMAGANRSGDYIKKVPAGGTPALELDDGRTVSEITVIADSPEPVPPCGGCRQKIAEFAGQDVRVTLCTTDGKSKVMTVAELLPGVFTAAHMDRA